MNARSWLADVREHADPQLSCILVGNKVDLISTEGGGRHREVSYEEAELFAKEEGLLFVEASAKSGKGVEEAFERACLDILDKIKRGVFDDGRVCYKVPFFFALWLTILDLQSLGVKLSKPANNNSLTLEQTPKQRTCCS
jgi:Ras-related protein Rab-2A